MKDTVTYTYAAPLPKAENRVFAALVASGGEATASELFTALDQEVNLPLIYTIAARLEKKGLLTRQQREYDLGPLGKGTRTTYVTHVKGEISMKDEEARRTNRPAHSQPAVHPFSTAAPTPT
jgi:predicted transcriptional regulator